MRDKNGVAFDGRAEIKMDFSEVGEEETVIRIYCMKKIFSIEKHKVYFKWYLIYTNY